VPRNPDTEQSTNTPQLETMMGFHNEHFKIGKETFSKIEQHSVNGFNATFKIKAGPLEWQDTVMKTTYMIHITYQESEEQHRKTLDLNGFDSFLANDYADKANEIALKLINEKGWKLHNHLNSWPDFQAIVGI